MKKQFCIFFINLILVISVVWIYQNYFDKDENQTDILNKLMIETTLYDLEFHKLEIELTKFDLEKLNLTNEYQKQLLLRYENIEDVIAKKEVFQLQANIAKTNIDIEMTQKKLQTLLKIDDKLVEMEKCIDASKVQRFFLRKRLRKARSSSGDD